MYLDQPFIARAASSAYEPNPTVSSVQEQMFDQMMAHSMSEMDKRTAEIKESLEKINEDA